MTLSTPAHVVVVTFDAPRRLLKAGWRTVAPPSSAVWCLWHPFLGTVEFDVRDTLDGVYAIVRSPDPQHVLALLKDSP